MSRYQIDPKYSFDTETREVVNNRTLEALPEDEPRILFRAQDICTIKMLEAYYVECTAQGASKTHLDSIRERIHEFQMWQRAHANRVKRPD